MRPEPSGPHELSSRICIGLARYRSRRSGSRRVVRQASRSRAVRARMPPKIFLTGAPVICETAIFVLSYRIRHGTPAKNSNARTCPSQKVSVHSRSNAWTKKASPWGRAGTDRENCAHALSNLRGADLLLRPRLRRGQEDHLARRPRRDLAHPPVPALRLAPLIQPRKKPTAQMARFIPPLTPRGTFA